MKLQVPFLQLPVLFDAAALAREIAAIDARWWRGRTQHDDGNSALTLITTHGDPDSDELGGPMRPTPALAQCPYLMQVLEHLGATWGRARLMRLSGQAEVRAHVDINYYWRERMRVHVPIVTTPSVRFRCGEGEVNMAAGECWIFDTWRRHRVLNGSDDTRIHLVADTVGGERFWDLLAQARLPGARGTDWQPQRFPAQAERAAAVLDFESINAPAVMSPWELREHIVFLLGEAVPDPRLGPIQQALLRFARRWQALWAAHGDSGEGLPRYRRLLDGIHGELDALGVSQIGLKNELGFQQVLAAHVLEMAVATPAGESRLDRHGDDAAGVHAGAAPVPEPVPIGDAVHAGDARDPIFQRPLFIVSPPRSGSTLLFETVATAPGLYSPGDESHALIEGVPGLSPASRGWDSNRLLAADASTEAKAALRERFLRQLRDRDGRAPAGVPVRMLEKTPKNALRIPFLRAVFPEARFVFLYRDPRQVLGSMIDGWRSGDFRMYPGLPDWEGPTWSFLLTPGWRESSGRPLEEIVARQWASATTALLDDLKALPADLWTGIRHDDFLADPQQQATRLCAWAGLGWDRVVDRELPLSRYTLTAPDPDKWRRHAAAIEAQRAIWEPVAARAEALLRG